MILCDIEEVLRTIPDDLPYKSSVKRALWQAPRVDVHEGEKAVWVKRDNTDKGFVFLCSACGKPAYAKPNARKIKTKVTCTYRFCPNCGSVMEVEE